MIGSPPLAWLLLLVASCSPVGALDDQNISPPPVARSAGYALQLNGQQHMVVTNHAMLSGLHQVRFAGILVAVLNQSLCYCPLSQVHSRYCTTYR